MHPSDLEIDDHEIDAQTHVVELGGQIDLYSAPEFKQRTLEVIGRGKKQVVIDLSRVSFMDSTGLSVLVGALKRLRRMNGSLTVVAPDEGIRRLFEMTGLDGSFLVCRSQEEALETLTGPRGA
jgi:anti-sigma B factor antagonist